MLTQLITSFRLVPVLLLLCGSAFADDMNVIRSCAVNSVHDGDTMRVTCDGKKIKVRLYCIDTPELAQRPWGGESRDVLRSITGQKVSLVDHGKDRYGRVLAEVFSDGKNLNLALVSGGNAAVYIKYCKLDTYYQAEQTARLAQLGIWSKPGLQQTPWLWRKQMR